MSEIQNTNETFSLQRKFNTPHQNSQYYTVDDYDLFVGVSSIEGTSIPRTKITYLDTSDYNDIRNISGVSIWVTPDSWAPREGLPIQTIPSDPKLYSFAVDSSARWLAGRKDDISKISSYWRWVHGFFGLPTETELNKSHDRLARILLQSREYELNIALQTLSKLKQNCKIENWDGEGAEPISEDAFKNVETLLSILPNNIPFPEILPDPDGEIVLDWQGKRGVSFGINVSGNNVFSYSGIFGKRINAYGTEKISDKFPKEITIKIERVFNEF